MSRDVQLDEKSNEMKRLKKLERRKKREAKERARLEASQKSGEELADKEAERDNTEHNNNNSPPKIISFEDNKTVEDESRTGEDESPTGEDKSPTGGYESPTGEDESPTGEDESPTVARKGLVEVAITKDSGLIENTPVEPVDESSNYPTRDDSSLLSSSSSSSSSKKKMRSAVNMATKASPNSSSSPMSPGATSVGSSKSIEDGEGETPELSNFDSSFIRELLEAEHAQISSQITALSGFKTKLELWLGLSKSRVRGRGKRPNIEPAAISPSSGSISPPSTPRLQCSFSRYWSIVRKKGNVTKKEAGEQWKILKAAGKDKEFFLSEDAVRLQSESEIRTDRTSQQEIV